MHLTKKFFLLMGILLPFSLIARPYPQEPVKQRTHITYVTNEYYSNGESFLSIGYRYQNKFVMIDSDIGYQYFRDNKMDYTSLKMGISVGRSIYKLRKGQIYVGIGLDFLGVKTLKRSGFKYPGNGTQTYYFNPLIRIGHDFKINSLEIVFCEIIYKPYSFGITKNEPLHSLGTRIGIGF